MYAGLARLLGLRNMPLFDILTEERYEQVRETWCCRHATAAPLPCPPTCTRSWPMHWRHEAYGLSGPTSARRGMPPSRGEHFIVTTGTASGKSLCFNLPVIDHLLQDTRARGHSTSTPRRLWRRIRSAVCAPSPGARWSWRYTTVTRPPDARRLARQHARLLLTNPDMVSMAMLPHHERWGDFFFNLSYVVIDEAHTYRGVFGSHIGNVLRRLRRVAAFYGAEPRFILASATIGNATEHAERLTGLPITPVTDDGAPSGRRKILLWNPPLVDELLNLRSSNTMEAADILAELMRNGVRTICFTKSRRSAELVYQHTADRLSDSHSDLAKRLSPYRAGYTPEQRRGIEARLFSGDLLAVVSTNALELGIDVGALDAVHHGGLPRHRGQPVAAMGPGGARQG